MRIVPKAQYGRQLVAQSDNTRVARPVLVERMEYSPRPDEFFITDRRTGKKVLVKRKNETISADRRNTYQRKQDEKRTQQLHRQYEEDKKQEEGMRNLQGFLTFISPSTYVGPVFNNNGKSYVESVMSGEGIGSTAGNVAIDMLTPFAIGGAKSLTSSAIRRLNIPVNTTRSIRLPWMKQKQFYQFSPEQLSEQKKEFLQQMSLQGLEFKGARQYPELASDIQKGFLRPGTGETIIPKDRSDIGIYLDWMDQNFNISTPREAKALPANSFGKGVMGDYNQGTGVARINTAYPQEAGSTFIHELGSHGTDMQVADRVIENYPFTLRYPSVADFLRADVGKFRMDPTVQNIYSNIASISPGLGNTIKNRLINKNFKLTHGTNFLKGSSKWYEARATLNEIRAKMFKYGDFPDAAKRLEKRIDSAEDSEILEMMEATNGYGEDYYRAYNLLSPKRQKQWMERVRHALKYLPATTPFIFPAIQNKNEG